MIFVGIGAATYFSLAPKWPEDQHLRLLLGDAAKAVTEVRVRCGKDPGSAATGDVDWMREVSFRYAAGDAPRLVAYDPRLPEGDYLVEIDVDSVDSSHRATDHRVKLSGGTTQIDLTGAAGSRTRAR